MVKVGDLSIWTTQHHPFWTDDRGWVAAAELCNGDLLRTLDGTLLPVAEVRVSDIIEPVFNVRVEERHTFFVGDDRCSILVHNQSPATSSAATFAPVVVPRPAPSSAAPAGAGSVRSSLSPPSSVGVPAHIPSTGTPDDEEPRNADEVRAFGWLPDLGGDNYSRQRLIKNYRKNIQDRATADFNKRLEGLRDYAQEYVDQGLISQEDADRIVAGAKGPFIHAEGQPFDSIRDAENQLAAEAQRIRAKEGETDAPSPPVPSTDAGGARKGGGRKGAEGYSAAAQVPKEPVTWTNASPEYIKHTRHEFEKSGGVREQFWKNEYENNREAYTSQNQALIKQGKAPFGTDGKPMVLHHKIPIEYGGTNNFANLQPMRYTDHSLTPHFGPMHTPPFPK